MQFNLVRHTVPPLRGDTIEFINLDFIKVQNKNKHNIFL